VYLRVIRSMCSSAPSVTSSASPRIWMYREQSHEHPTCLGRSKESGPEKRRPVLRPSFAPQGRADTTSVALVKSRGPTLLELHETRGGSVSLRSRLEH
jgi:hypothetical protein